MIVKEALANGRLTSRGAVPGLAAVADEMGAAPDAVALAAALAQPWADVVLSGATTTAQLQSNLSALELALDPSALERLGALAEDPDGYWSSRSALRWT